MVFDVNFVKDAVTKYKMAADIANKTVAALVAACQPGATAFQLCGYGDNLVHKQVPDYIRLFNAN